MIAPLDAAPNDSWSDHKARGSAAAPSASTASNGPHEDGLAVHELQSEEKPDQRDRCAEPQCVAQRARDLRRCDERNVAEGGSRDGCVIICRVHGRSLDSVRRDAERDDKCREGNEQDERSDGTRPHGARVPVRNRTATRDSSAS